MYEIYYFNNKSSFSTRGHIPIENQLIISYHVFNTIICSCQFSYRAYDFIKICLYSNLPLSDYVAQEI